PDNARAVGVIDHQPAIVLLRYLLDFLQWRTIAVHAEHTFCHYQLLPRTGGSKQSRQMSDIVMSKTAKRRRA
ncbi:hypothetical protein QP104_08005, partial [Alloscardovia omnicolens]